MGYGIYTYVKEQIMLLYVINHIVFICVGSHISDSVARIWLKIYICSKGPVGMVRRYIDLF